MVVTTSATLKPFAYNQWLPVWIPFNRANKRKFFSPWNFDLYVVAAGNFLVSSDDKDWSRDWTNKIKTAMSFFGYLKRFKKILWNIETLLWNIEKWGAGIEILRFGLKYWVSLPNIRGGSRIWLRMVLNFYCAWKLNGHTPFCICMVSASALHRTESSLRTML